VSEKQNIAPSDFRHRRYLNSMELVGNEEKGAFFGVKKNIPKKEIFSLTA
jgi:hypothetical protein